MARGSLQLHLDRVIDENLDLREQVFQLKTQVQRLEEKAALLAQERTELALWISEHQRDQRTPEGTGEASMMERFKGPLVMGGVVFIALTVQDYWPWFPMVPVMAAIAYGVGFWRGISYRETRLD